MSSALVTIPHVAATDRQLAPCTGQRPPRGRASVSLGMAVPVIVLNGPIGVGKSVVLGEVSDLLQEVEASHCAVDLDALSQTFPRHSNDWFMLRLAVDNLRAVWSNAAQAGAERLVLASVVETISDLQLMLGAVPGAVPFVCRLHAPVALLHERLRRREIGTGLDSHLRRASELATILEDGEVDDVVVDASDRPLRSIAADVLEAAGWPRPQ